MSLCVILRGGDLFSEVGDEVLVRKSKIEARSTREPHGVGSRDPLKDYRDHDFPNHRIFLFFDY